MNIALIFNDINRYWTPGSYIKRLLASQNDLDIVAHPRVPEDVPIIEESNSLDIDLAFVVDCSVHYKLHHSKGKLAKKTKTAIWLSDLHRPDWAKWRLQMIQEWRYDHVFYAQKDFRKMILESGYEQSECSWLPHATDPEVFKPMPQITKKYDIGFVGYMNPKRERIINIIKENHLNFKHYDSVWELNAARAINECRIGLNIPVETDVCNMRTFETMSCGIPLLIEKNDNGLSDLFESDMYMTYLNEDNLIDKVLYLLSKPDLVESMSKKAREHVLKFHTYRNRINTILGTMGFSLLK